MESTMFNDQIQQRIETCHDLQKRLAIQLVEFKKAKAELNTQDVTALSVVLSLWEEILQLGAFVAVLGEESARMVEHVQKLTKAHNDIAEAIVKKANAHIPTLPLDWNN